MARPAYGMEPPYCEALTGILSFSSFAAAEHTLERLEDLRRKYQSASDKKGVEYCRQIAALGRRRAEMIGRNKRVSLRARRQKQEMANWFRIWLETPALFADWLAMRKDTEEFRELLRSECSQKSKAGERHGSGAETP